DSRSLDAFKRRVVSRALQLMPRLIATEYPSTAIERATREFLRSPSPEAGESRLESGCGRGCGSWAGALGTKNRSSWKIGALRFGNSPSFLGLASVTSSRLPFTRDGSPLRRYRGSILVGVPCSKMPTFRAESQHVAELP